jgi:chaperonin cofactor prefoldin
MSPPFFMTDNDLKAVVAKYQQKSFELFNQNIVLETQIETLQKQVQSLTQELEKLKSKRPSKTSSSEF